MNIDTLQTLINTLPELSTRSSLESMSYADQRRIFGFPIFGKLRFCYHPQKGYSSAHFQIVERTISRDWNYQDISLQEICAAINNQRKVRYCK